MLIDLKQSSGFLPMEIIMTPIKGLAVVETKPFCDQRGAFYRAFCDGDLEPLLLGRVIRQMNVSRTEAVGAIRGMHFQHPPHAEMKLIRCLRGRVWDVALDLRAESPTFLQWYGVELSPDNACMMVIPEGCAHGFQVLESGSELLYLHTSPYAPSAEGGVLYNDPRVNIQWKIPATDMSQRDISHLLLSSDFKGLVL
jgi:dTDP-4-dehydrorhamnose 3,5-epimerase